MRYNMAGLTQACSGPGMNKHVQVLIAVTNRLPEALAQGLQKSISEREPECRCCAQKIDSRARFSSA